MCVGAYANQDLSFEQLVESLHPNRDANRMPLFQVWFALQNLPRSVFEISGLELKPLEVHNGTSKFDLGMFVAETPDGLACTVEYATDLFDRATIQSLLRHYGTLLESIVAQPGQRISVLTLLHEEERKELIVGRNEPLETFSEEACIHELFENQVRKSPAATAVVFGDAQLTYAELNARANQLAHRLRGMGVGPETLVGICLDPSLEMLVAVLGVLKAGGAYLPVDTSYPQDRQTFMLRDGQVPVVITGAAFSAPLPSGAVRINLEDHAGRLSSEFAENPRSVGGADSLAYVIYTSGSTGTSKGVMIPHRNVTRLFRATGSSLFRDSRLSLRMTSTTCWFVIK
jgi:aspartate racemase